MATNPSIKKSSIPRPSHHDFDRTDPAKLKSKVPKPPQSQPSHSRPPVNDGLLKEDEDSIRRSLLDLESDHTHMKKTLEDTVREAEERLGTMKKLMAEREKLHAVNLNAAADRTQQLEQQVEDYEKTLIENNIDPATGETQEPTAEQSAAVEKQKKVTKGDVSKMREKLQQLNDASDKYLVDVQGILQEIEEVQAVSERAGGIPVTDTPTGDEMTALIKEVEEAQRKEDEKKKKEKKKKKEEEGSEDEEDDDEEESPSSSPTQESKEDSQRPSKSDVFLTQK